MRRRIQNAYSFLFRLLFVVFLGSGEWLGEFEHPDRFDLPDGKVSSPLTSETGPKSPLWGKLLVCCCLFVLGGAHAVCFVCLGLFDLRLN